jgi:hypothetical protein
VSAREIDAVRLSQMFLQSCRDADVAKARIQIMALADIKPPGPVLDISEAAAQADAEYRARRAQREAGE